LWLITLNGEQAPALEGRLDGQRLRLVDLFHDPRDRDHDLDIVALAHFRERNRTMTPRGEMMLHAGDELLLAGHLRDKAALHTTLTEASTLSYVLDGRRVPDSWIWRWVTRADKAEKTRRDAHSGTN
jgi:voltage-gated potassium channel